MGRLILVALIVLAVVLVWKAFGPSSWKRNQVSPDQAPKEIKGPDDDEEFLWKLERDRFKQRREEERRQEERRQEERRQQERKKRRPTDNEEEGGAK